MRRLGDALVPCAVLAALACGCFARLVAEPSALILDGRRPSVDHANHGDPRPIGNDAVFVFLPHHLQVARSLRQFGHLPAWDRSGFGGRPMIGNPQGGLFYPPVWLAWWHPQPSVLGWLTVAHLFWGGLGCYLLARGEGLRRGPSIVTAGVFQASPYLLAQVFEGHYPHVWSVSWFPWAMRAYLDHRAGRPRGLFALPPILALSALAGHPQEWILLVVTLSVWTVCESAWQVCRAGRGALRLLAGWVLSLGLALGLAAVDLVPMLKLRSWMHGPGSVEPPGLPRNYAIQLHNVLQWLSPWALGGPDDYLGPDNYWEALFSFGLVPLLLIAVGAGAIVRGRAGAPGIPQSAAGWIILAAASIGFAAGPGLGLFTVLSRLVPGMASFRTPGRSLFLTAIAAAMLAGIGLEALRNRWEDPAAWRRFAARLGAAIVLVVALLTALRLGLPSALGSLSSRHAWRAEQAAARILADPVFALTITGLAAAVASGCGPGTWRRVLRGPHLVGVLALAELACQGHALLQVTPASQFFGVDPVSQAIIALPPPDPSGAPPRLRARDNFYLDLQAVRHGLEKTNFNDVFQLGHAAALYEQLYAVATVRSRLPSLSFHLFHPDEQRRIRQAIFDRMAVSYLVSDRVEEDPFWPVAASGLNREGRPFSIQRNPAALPRAYVVPRAEVVADDAITVLRRFPRSDPRLSVLMTSDPLASIPSEPRQSFTPARWLGRDPDHPRLEVSTTAPGLLVIADTWMPGWSARLDGRPVPVLRGNHAQQVIPLEHPGHHHIELAYTPPGLTLGATVTILSALAWAAHFTARHATRRSRFQPRWDPRHMHAPETGLAHRIHQPAMERRARSRFWL